MFGLLNPFALWLAPLLVAPLVIHFLGRSNPRLLDFPSLLPVQGQLTRAMRRARLKNWLQLLLRTLALLFLLLAAANPLWRPRNGLTPPAAAGLLFHNGAYAAIPLSGGITILDGERGLQRGLDSLTSGQCRTELLLSEASGREPAARFGSYPEALPRLLRDSKGKPSYHLHLPVFDWRDLQESEELLHKALTQNPGLKLVLTEFPDAQQRLTPFANFSLSFPKENLAALRAKNLVSTLSSVQALWTPTAGAPREIKVGRDSVELLLPIGQAGWLNGELTLPPPAGEAFGFPSAAFSARIPPPATMCHVGNAFASLASLGRGGLRLQIRSFLDARGMVAERSRSMEFESCTFLYLADPKEMDATLLGRAAEIARSGGKVILGLGRNADIPLLNRNLLQPLGVGRLVELKQQPALRLRAHPTAFSALGIKVSGWGDPGVVQSHIALRPDTGTTVLLSAGDNPILVHRKTGKGALLVWTTDADDPEWTDLGLGPWVALVHQGFTAETWTEGIGTQWVASDSTLSFPATESESIRILDPSGSPVSRLRRDPYEWRAGPFDRLGLHRIERLGRNGADTAWFAVGLATERLQPEAGSRDGFLAAMKEMKSRVVIRKAGDDWRNLYGGFRLRLWLLILAALLLFLEGVISLRLGPAMFAAKRD